LDALGADREIQRLAGLQTARDDEDASLGSAIEPSLFRQDPYPFGDLALLWWHEDTKLKRALIGIGKIEVEALPLAVC